MKPSVHERGSQFTLKNYPARRADDINGFTILDLSGGRKTDAAPESGLIKNGWPRIRRGNIYKPMARDQFVPSSQTVLLIINKILRTKAKDMETVDLTSAWGVILDEIKPYDDIIPFLVLHFQADITLNEAAKALGLPLYRTASRFQFAIEKLRHPCRLKRIRNSIMGWPNLYRNT